MKDFQQRVAAWVALCFGMEATINKVERNHRFLEEALELVQSLNCTKGEVLDLVDYVYNRPKGEPYQELGGVMVSLAALASASKMDMVYHGETELARINSSNIIEKCRMKQATKPKHSSIPGTAGNMVEQYVGE